MKYSFWNIVGRSFDFFVKNFNSLFKSMLLPVLLQVFGIILSLFPAIYLTYVLKLKSDDIIAYLCPITVCTVAGLLMYCSGVWKYILLNCYYVLAVNDYDENKGMYMEIYRKSILKNEKKFIQVLLWPAFYMFLIFIVSAIIIAYCFALKSPASILFAILLFTISIVSLLVFYVKISFLIQIFVFELDLKPIDVMKKSFEMIKTSIFFKLVGLLLILCVISIILQIVFSLFASLFFGIFVKGLVLEGISNFISNFALLFLLPLNVSFVTLLYKDVSSNKRITA